MLYIFLWWHNDFCWGAPPKLNDCDGNNLAYNNNIFPTPTGVELPTWHNAVGKSHFNGYATTHDSYCVFYIKLYFCAALNQRGCTDFPHKTIYWCWKMKINVFEGSFLKDAICWPTKHRSQKERENLGLEIIIRLIIIEDPPPSHPSADSLLSFPPDAQWCTQWGCNLLLPNWPTTCSVETT
jgi:hypothetical protein